MARERCRLPVAGDMLVFELLLDFRFLVHDMLTYFRIKFLHFELFGHGALVLGRRVVMTCTSARYHFYFVSHFLYSLGYCMPGATKLVAVMVAVKIVVKD